MRSYLQIRNFLQRHLFTFIYIIYIYLHYLHLRIESVRREDRGEYTCTADNQVSPPVSKHFEIKVYEGI